MSTRPRAPSVPVAPIPPYRGGPLQPREDMNTVGVDSRSATSSKQTSSGKAVPTVTRKPSHGASHRSSAHPTATYAQEQRAPGAARDAARTDKSRQSASRKPQKRLERENKPDDKDPPNIGPWKLGEVIGRGASGTCLVAVEYILSRQAHHPSLCRTGTHRTSCQHWAAGCCQNHSHASYC